MFLDKVEITIKAGNGGNGHTSFHRDRQTMRGGPDGGDGGRGGGVIFVGTTRADNLVEFRYTKKFLASDGTHGRPGNKNGAVGADLEIPVPLGTKIYKTNNQSDNRHSSFVIRHSLIADITLDGQKYIALRGGAGGRGNARFATAKRQTPNFSQTGVVTTAHNVILELNSIADVGLIGFPNVGKSTLLSVVTRANPKIANYHFTTLHPNIGVHDNVVIADIPGLIEGASTGIGLGHDFLKHINRTRLLVHVVDISEQEQRNAINDFEVINKELAAFSPILAKKPQIVALNKIDAADEKTIAAFKKKYEKKYKIFEISAATHAGVKELMQHVSTEVACLPRIKPETVTAELEGRVDKNAFEIIIENSPFCKGGEKAFLEREGKMGFFRVTGSLVDNLIRGVVLSDTESASYFHRRLEEAGVIAALKNVGMCDGDTVRIADTEFQWTD